MNATQKATDHYSYCIHKLLCQSSIILCLIRTNIVAIDKPGRKRNLVQNINTQHKVFNRRIITETLIKQKLNSVKSISVLLLVMSLLLWVY